MKNHHEVGHFKNRLMIGLLSLSVLFVMAGQSFAAMTCFSCHGMPPLDSAVRSPTSGAFKGGHQKHMGVSAAPAECTKCHGNSGYTTGHAATSGNMIKMNVNINNSPLVATYGTKGTSFAQTATPILESCSNVNCHFETVTPAWGATAPATSCSSCHSYPAASANHSKHLSSTAQGATITCSVCHPDYGTTSFSHATSAGKHKIVVNPLMNYAGGTAISWLPSQPKAFGTCNTVYCHSNGKGTYNNPTWGATNSAGCAFCHPTLSAGHTPHIGTLLSEINFYNYTSTKSSGTGYKFGCALCHPLTVASHMNNTVEIDLTASASGGHMKNLNGAGATINGSKQCSNVYCHSNGYKPGASYTFATTPVWGATFTGDRCAACHGNSPDSVIAGSKAHSAHVVGIHYDDIFNGVSKKLPQSGTAAVNAAHGKNSRSTTINCNICHNATVTSSANDSNAWCSGCHNGTTAPLKNSGSLIADSSKHVNGSVDVVFINQTIATKAQVAGKAFVAYTAKASGWSRRSNSMPFKTYTSSYDYTKSTLASAASAYTSGAGCINVACHASITVKWTDTVTCVSCHTRLN